MSKLRVLNVGAGPDVENPWGEDQAEMLTMDINPDVKPDILHDVTQPWPEELQESFDIVVCLHMLEHIDRISVPQVFEQLTGALKMGGELWIAVPALEWAANKIARGEVDASVLAHIYGSQADPWQYHKCGFTLGLLRSLCERYGLIVREAVQKQYIIGVDDKQIRALQNTIIALKVGSIK